MNFERPRVYLLDVEGTVAPLSLTADQLFPYARARLANFLALNAEDPSVRNDLLQLSRESSAETESTAPRIPGPAGTDYLGTPDFQMRALVYLHWLMDRDRKSTTLKSLQGKIWKAGFESGELKGTLFDDVPRAFARWSAHGRVAIYSSGSVEAQQLLFRHSIFGDLTPLIAAYFDTRTGVKTESSSYVAIATAMNVDPLQACFFSDVLRELGPARDSGMDTRLVDRPGNAPVADAANHSCIESLDEVS